MAENKNEAFKRISASRLEKAQKAISLLGNLNSNNYESSNEERLEIINALLAEVERLSEDYNVEIKKESKSEVITEEVETEDENAEELVEVKDYTDKKMTNPTVLKVVRDLEFGEMPIFSSVLQEALINFAKKQAGSDKHLRQLLRISAFSLKAEN